MNTIDNNKVSSRADKGHAVDLPPIGYNYGNSCVDQYWPLTVTVMRV